VLQADVAGRAEGPGALPERRSSDWLAAYQRGAIAERPSRSRSIGMLDSERLAYVLREGELRRKRGLLADWQATDRGDWIVAGVALVVLSVLLWGC
jgi:hypothetical protein